jgi:hypothetical protein
MDKKMTRDLVALPVAIILFALVGATAPGCVSDDVEESCDVVQDCDPLPWTIRCLGHWTCQQGECVPECGEPETHPAPLTEPECTEPPDCDELPWPIRCPGEWSCVEGECVAECSER